MSLEILNQQIEALRNSNPIIAMKLSVIKIIVKRWYNSCTLEFQVFEKLSEDQKTRTTWISTVKSIIKPLPSTWHQFSANQIPLIAKELGINLLIK